MKKGFTLIELMIVVVIIGILAAIAIPKFSDVSESAKRSACRANMRTLASQQAIYFALNSSFANTLAILDMAGVTCPSDGSAYDMAGNTTEYHISCPTLPGAAAGQHGNIDNGIPSWHDNN